MRARTLVAIVNYRTPELVVDCLDSLEPEVLANPGTIVIVVDNDSGDRSPEVIGGAVRSKGYEGWCRLVVAPRNGGFSYGNNLAIGAWRDEAPAGGAVPASFPDYVWLLNPDTRALPGALGALVEFMEARPDVGIAGGRALTGEGKVRSSAFRFPSVLSEAGLALNLGPVRSVPLLAPLARLLARHAVKLPVPDRPTRVDWVNGATFFVRRAVFERIGTFDEGYFLYWEETDFCLRAARAGIACWYLPASRIVHVGGKSTGVRWAERRPPYWFKSRARFFRLRYGRYRWHGANLVWLVLAPLGWLAARLRGSRPKWPPLHWWDLLRYSYARRIK